MIEIIGFSWHVYMHVYVWPFLLKNGPAHGCDSGWCSAREKECVSTAYLLLDIIPKW